MSCDICHKPTARVTADELALVDRLRASITRVRRPAGLPQLTARVTADELALVDRLAQAAGMSRADWIRLRSLTTGGC